MSDPIAVSILAKLTSWYSFDGDTTDAHGSNDIDTGLVIAGYSAGLHGQQLDDGSRGYHTLAAPVSITTTTGNMTVGGWFNFVSGVSARPEFGLSYGGLGGDEALTIVANPDGFFYLQTYISTSVDDPVVDPLAGATNHPVTFRVDDSFGQQATSSQVIRILRGGAMEPGRYFVVGTWDEGNRILYVDSINVASKGPPATLNNSGTIPRIGVGRTSSSSASCVTDLDECFVCLDGTLTAEEVSWLYNSGLGRSYADVVAAAA